MSGFIDGLKNIYSSIIERRSATTTNVLQATTLDYASMNAMFRSGLGSKIIRLKAGAALSDTLLFESSEDEDFWKEKLEKHVKSCARYMMAFGRGVILVHNVGEDLSKPLGKINHDRLIVRHWSGDMVTVGEIDRDLESPRYQKPLSYNVWGNTIHHSRIVDFRYVEPVELDLPLYRYGGISEFELIYDQYIADGVIQRACPAILEKSSNWIYKVAGFNSAVRQKQDTQIVEAFTAIENMRSIYGSTIVDKEDDVVSLSQALQNLSEIDQISLRRLAMVTGIPLAVLIGENVKGLNSTGDNELAIYHATVRTFEEDYLLEPINELMLKCGQAKVRFKENQGQTPSDSAMYDQIVIDNAVKLASIGSDFGKYLEDRGVVEPDDFMEMFGDLNAEKTKND